MVHPRAFAGGRAKGKSDQPMSSETQVPVVAQPASQNDHVARTVTLAVTQEQAERFGVLKLVVRAPDDPVLTAPETSAADDVFTTAPDLSQLATGGRALAGSTPLTLGGANAGRKANNAG